MSDDPVRKYLDGLRRELGRLGSLRRRRLLAEAEDHLREAAAELEATGIEPAEAARRAVDAFGGPGDVAGATAAPHIRWGLGVAVAAAILAAVFGFRHSQPASIRTAQLAPINAAQSRAPKTSAAAVIRSVNARLPRRAWLYIRIGCQQCVGPYAETQTLVAAYRRSAIAGGFRPEAGVLLYNTVDQ